MSVLAPGAACHECGYTFDDAELLRDTCLVPGEGELPLRDMLAALPRDRVVGLEVPLRSEALAGVGPRERLGRCVAAARDLLAQLD